MEDGAVATVKLPFRLNQGIHGWWVPDNNTNDVRGTT
jgi:carotenoid cleavage dioxygenase-like enzyme